MAALAGGAAWRVRMAVPAAAKRLAAARAAVKSRVSSGCGGALLGGLEVADDLFAVELVVVGQDVGVGHVEDFEAEDAGLLLLVDEGGVGEFGEPVVVVEDGVVDAVGAVGADVGGGNAEVLDEGGVVGAGAEIADADVVLDLGVEAAGASAAGVAVATRWPPGSSSTGRRRCRPWGWGLLW